MIVREMVVGNIDVYNGFKYCPELYMGKSQKTDQHMDLFCEEQECFKGKEPFPTRVYDMLVEVKTVTSIYLSVMHFLHVSQTSGCEIGSVVLLTPVLCRANKGENMLLLFSVCVAVCSNRPPNGVTSNSQKLFIFF